MGKSWALSIGTALCVITQIALAFIDKEYKNFMYGIAPLIGVA